MEYNLYNNLFVRNIYNLDSLVTEESYISEITFRKMLKNHCNQYKFNKNQQIFAALNITHPFLHIVPPNNKIDKTNHYRSLIDSSEIWNIFPDLNYSVAGINNKNTVKKSGNIYVLIPYNNAIFGIGPKEYFLNSFIYLRERDFDTSNFNSMFEYFYVDIVKEQLKYDNLNDFKECLSYFDINKKVINIKIKKYKGFFMKEIWKKFNNNNPSNLNFHNFIAQTIFSPTENNFKAIKWYQKTKIPFNKKVWSDCNFLLIKKDYINKIK